jgi:transposase
LIAPAYVKPFVKRQKSDAADAEAIREAAQRPTMRFVAVKSEEAQGSAIVFPIPISRPCITEDNLLRLHI